MKNRKHTEEFKREAIKLAEKLGSVTEATRQLGIKDNLIYSWRAKFKTSSKSTPEKNEILGVESEEIKRLKKENEELKKVNYILKKAAAFFSQDHLK